MTGEEQELLENTWPTGTSWALKVPTPTSSRGTGLSATPRDLQHRPPWKKRRSCATRTSWTPPGSSPAKGESRIRVEQVIPKTRRRNDLIR